MVLKAPCGAGVKTNSSPVSSKMEGDSQVPLTTEGTFQASFSYPFPYLVYKLNPKIKRVLKSESSGKCRKS
jgi:hypothetical protein